VTVATRTDKLDLRLTRGAKRVLNAAARAARRSVSEFVLASALARAQGALPDRQHFGLDAARWQALLAALEAPVRPLPRMGRLLAEPSVFERDPQARWTVLRGGKLRRNIALRDLIAARSRCTAS
jgi:uncharacterized protein (DUF1778 family)